MNRTEVLNRINQAIDEYIDSLSEDEINALTNDDWCYIIDFSELARMKYRK